MHPTYSIEFMSMRGGSIDYTARMYSIQEHTSVRRRKARQPAAVPWPAIPGPLARGPRAAPAGGRGWPWRSRAGTPGRASPDSPGAAGATVPAQGVCALPCARVSGRHCSGRETAPGSHCSGRTEETRVGLGKSLSLGWARRGTLVAEQCGLCSALATEA